VPPTARRGTVCVGGSCVAETFVHVVADVPWLVCDTLAGCARRHGLDCGRGAGCLSGVCSAPPPSCRRTGLHRDGPRLRRAREECVECNADADCDVARFCRANSRVRRRHMAPAETTWSGCVASCADNAARSRRPVACAAGSGCRDGACVAESARRTHVRRGMFCQRPEPVRSERKRRGSRGCVAGVAACLAGHLHRGGDALRDDCAAEGVTQTATHPATAFGGDDCNEHRRQPCTRSRRNWCNSVDDNATRV